MPDNLLQIGGLDVNNSREKLYQPHPLKKITEKVLLVDDNTQSQEVYKKISTKKQLNSKINTLKKLYKTYLTKKYNFNCEYRNRINISSFLKYSIDDLSHINYFDYSSDTQNWKKVNIPEYNGPVGYAISLYKTNFNCVINKDKAYFIHFQCADYIAQIYINRNYVGEHEGFFSSFEFDISQYINNGDNELLIVLKNDYRFNGEGSNEDENILLQGDKMYAATGPGYDDPNRGWHHCPAGMGIFGYVYIEERNTTFLSNLYIKPNIDKNEIEIQSDIYRVSYLPTNDIVIEYNIYKDNFGNNELVKSYKYTPITLNHVNGTDLLSERQIENLGDNSEIIKLKFFRGENLVKLLLDFNNFEYWTQGSPKLYCLVATLYLNGVIVDTQKTTFGMRKFVMDTSSKMKGMLYFNNSPIRLRGANTMGFEQQDIINNDIDLLISDMLTAKACNMNFLRITQRPVQEEIYDICDRIGLLLQTDLPLFTNLRRNKYTEALKQTKEMAILIRNHPSCVIISYINETMLNSNNLPHRHLNRDELDKFFKAADDIMSMYNPGVAIKHIDGDYDAPDTLFPDNHCYCFWYNGHGIDAGKLIRGYWLPIKKNWYCGCGEYGSEGLDSYEVMKTRYPASYLPTSDNDSTWNPGKIKDSQTLSMHYFFYSTPHTLKGWIKASQEYQKLATKYQTEAIRRNNLIVSSAIHLFIDAFPSGWMKTLIDCGRNPKPALFAYIDALSPILCSIRPERSTYFSNELASFETFICNDTKESYNNYKIKYELLKGDVLVKSNTIITSVQENKASPCARVSFEVPCVNSREKYTLRMILIDSNNKVIHYNDQDILVLPKSKAKKSTAIEYIGTEEFNNNIDKIVEHAKSGKTIIINNLDQGEYVIDNFKFKVKNVGMRPLHFVSCKTNHPITSQFEENDFRFWFDNSKDMHTPLVYKTFTGDNFIPILISGNTKIGSAWQNPVYPALVTGELKIGKGKIIINELDLKNHMCEPIAKIFKNTLYTY